jgi:predicted NodU family carbamoyl transferase
LAESDDEFALNSGLTRNIAGCWRDRRFAVVLCHRHAFCRLTGVPMVLNTSFNENEPVVCRPEQALDCFLRTKMDMLVLGNHLVRRQ